MPSTWRRSPGLLFVGAEKLISLVSLVDAASAVGVGRINVSPFRCTLPSITDMPPNFRIRSMWSEASMLSAYEALSTMY